MNGLIGIGLVLWLFVGIMAVVFHDELPAKTPEAQWALAALIFVFGPLVAAAVVCMAVIYAACTLGVGFHDLWRQLRPKRVVVPEARAKEKRRG